MKPAFAALIAAAFLITGCGGNTHSAKPAPASAAAAAMSLLQGCQALRADMVANGGPADRPALQQIVQRTGLSLSLAAQQFGEDAASAEPNVGNSNLWWIDAAELASDCRAAGVKIPTSQAG